jgi:hypothetical protein
MLCAALRCARKARTAAAASSVLRCARKARTATEQSSAKEKRDLRLRLRPWQSLRAALRKKTRSATAAKAAAKGLLQEAIQHLAGVTSAEWLSWYNRRFLPERPRVSRALGLGDLQGGRYVCGEICGDGGARFPPRSTRRKRELQHALQAPNAQILPVLCHPVCNL